MKFSDHSWQQDRGQNMRKVALWMRRYSDNRTLPILLHILLMSLFVVLGLSFFLLLTGGPGESAPLFSERHIVWIVDFGLVWLLVLVMAILISFPGPVRRRWLRYMSSPSGREGDITPPVLSKVRQRLFSNLIYLGLLLIPSGIQLLWTYIERSLGILPNRLWPPFYVICVTLYVFLLARVSKVSDLSWTNIFVLLYAVYGIMLLLGPPPYLSSIDPFAAMIACLLLALFIGYFINRLARARLQRLAGEMLADAPERF